MIVYAIVDDSSSPAHVLGEAVDVFVRREDAERFIEEVRNDEPQLASYLRIEERELEAGGLDLATQNSALAQLAQEYQDAQGEPQAAPVPKGKSRESELPSEADREKHKSDDGSDAPGSQNVLSRPLLLVRGLLWDGIVYGLVGSVHLTSVADPPMLEIIIPTG